MREIKFRAWHKKQSKMIYDVQKTEMVHHAMSSWSGEPSGLDHYFDEEWYELMQYTGLTDRNGQEIYEGDIIQHYAFDNGDTFVVEWDNRNGGWSGYGCFHEWKDSRVVGNILEGVDK